MLVLYQENLQIWKERQNSGEAIKDIGEILYATSKKIEAIEKYYSEQWAKFNSECDNA